MMFIKPKPRKAVLVFQLILIVVLIVAGLAACAAPAPPPIVQTRYQVERVPLPAGLLSCQAAPPVTPIPTKQSGVAAYVVQLYEAYEDCSDTVASIAQIENSPIAKQ